MGCDIHSFVETKNQETGKWEKATGFTSDHYDPTSSYFSSEVFKNGDTLLDARNYTEFGILADVRNGRGFAGCDTGDAIKPISMPKGLPKDISADIKKESDAWGCDGHSHSWLTAEEIANYDAEKTIKVNRGWVDVKVYKNFLETKNPYPCCGMVSGQNIIHASNEECEAIQEANPDKSVYTQIEWTQTAKESAQWLFGEALTQMMNRSKTGKGDDVRIVFWFDN